VPLKRPCQLNVVRRAAAKSLRKRASPTAKNALRFAKNALPELDMITFE
jgi:hypothetical protein